jgi:hypothetical protein
MLFDSVVFVIVVSFSLVEDLVDGVSNFFLLYRGLNNLFITRCILLLRCDWSSLDIILRETLSSLLSL